MKVFFSISRSHLQSFAAVERPLRVLFSFHYVRNEDMGELLKSFKHPVEVFSDSGAFSAYTLGKPIDEDEYVEWILKWKHLLSAAAGPDIINDAKRTQAATERMLKRVDNLPVLPTFHVGEDWKYLERYVAMSPYVAFGGMVPHIAKSSKMLTAWVRKAFSLTPETTKVHGFGMTTWKFLRSFPWYSVDSSSWNVGFKYALLYLFDERVGRLVTVTMSNPCSLLEHRELLAAYGLRATQL